MYASRSGVWLLDGLVTRCFAIGYFWLFSVVFGCFCGWVFGGFVVGWIVGVRLSVGIRRVGGFVFLLARYDSALKACAIVIFAVAR